MNNLYTQIYHLETLQEAFSRVEQNAGCSRLAGNGINM
jgi:hypothetical protein